MVDDLSNMDFKHFDLRARVRWLPDQQEWHVLPKFMEHAKSFHEELKKRKSEKPPEEPKRKKTKSARLGPW